LVSFQNKRQAVLCDWTKKGERRMTEMMWWFGFTGTIIGFVIGFLLGAWLKGGKDDS
jgi:cytochrome bd-type quinol oxidase subunit 2